MLKLELQYLGHLMQKVDSLQKTLMLGGIGGRRRRGQQRMRMAGWHHWLDGRELVNSGNWWCSGRPGVLQFMGFQRVRHDWETELTDWFSHSEKAMATDSSALAWEIPQKEEPGRLQSMGLWRIGQDWATSLSWTGERNGNPLQYSCLEKPRDGEAWWAATYGVAQVQIRLKWL